MNDRFFEDGRSADAAGNFEKSIRSYKRYLKNSPQSAIGYYRLAMAYQSNKNLNEAIACFEKSISLDPEFSDAWCDLGVALFEAGRKSEALISYTKAVSLDPNFAEAFYNHGLALLKMDLGEDAIDYLKQAIALNSNFPPAYLTLGGAYSEIGNFFEAMKTFNFLISKYPQYVIGIAGKADLLFKMNRLNEALDLYNMTIAANPNVAEFYNNRGLVFSALKKFVSAVENFDSALVLKPHYVKALVNKGEALRGLRDFDAAFLSFEEALRLDPQFENLLGLYVHVKMQIANWHHFEENKKKIETGINQKKNISPPFSMLSIIDDPVIHLQAVLSYTESIKLDSKKKTDWVPSNNSRIRIGYFSADFHNHATSYLLAEMFELHDDSQFELIAFSFGPEIQDEMRQRLVPAFEKFIDVSNKSDTDISDMARALKLDIAIDLKGYTTDSRPHIFAHGCAPVQINFIGYPGTMASKSMDYIVADKILIPEDYQNFYTEKVIYLPDSYQPNDSKRKIGSQPAQRALYGLPEESFVFCCFNNTYKIVPSVFASWMRILKANDQSVLWLLDDNESATKNLKDEAFRNGIDPERLIFAGRCQLDEHLARHACADLFLDTLPYNAHTTASDALWMGLPVLTQLGASFASRVAASLLSAVGIPELITHNQEAYESLAVGLSVNQDELKIIKQRLADNKFKSRLFDMGLYVKHLEAAYVAVHERHISGLSPDHIFVEASLRGGSVNR